MSTVDSTNPHQFSYDPKTNVCYRLLDFMGHPGYRIGDDGSVWSRRKTIGTYHKGSRTTLGDTWKKLKAKIETNGYLRIILYPNKRYHLVHKLVLLAFVGPRPDGMECCHGPDFTKSNCHLSNLRWGTQEENLKERNIAAGDRSAKSKVTEVDVQNIRKSYATGKYFMHQLASEYNLTISQIFRILSRRSWKHIT